MRLPFELDPAIIHHIIYSQAGSIGKAVIELIMNSVDASAKTVVISMTKDGFNCCDDGSGFATRDDVVRYFGRFGTPHQDGDATYGRFRLGRGQIMAHASTVWRSRAWQMTVDTRTMGYAYDLANLNSDQAVAGCEIKGSWYEPLTDTELMSATQEIRDLVRYTPVTVELNGRTITRDPLQEKWDHEDEFAWYRVKVEGAVSIYNQGVLVRNDAAQQWGAGGLIVSKKAIALNVSRTEILRKTCPVWKAIAKQFGAMASMMTENLGQHRKTEASREKAAHDLMSGTENLLKVFEREEVITLLPGKRHLSLFEFLELNSRLHGGKMSVVERASHVPKAEAMARAKIAQIVHPSTLSRFNCNNADEFHESLERILEVVFERWAELIQQDRYQYRIWAMDRIKVPTLIDFETLREAFVERTTMVSEKDALDKETRRMWTALRWSIQQYAGLCAGGTKRGGRLAWNSLHLNILLGHSNAMEAWTDGKSYIAFNVDIVKRLRADPIKVAGQLFSLAEHEIAHQGDSIDCGHDEAFYQRYHDISLAMAAERQRFMHLFIQKYVYSMEGEGNRNRSHLWREQRLIERANAGRQKRDLPPVVEDLSVLPFFKTDAMPEDVNLIRLINARLIDSGACPPPANWDAVKHTAQEIQERRSKQLREERKREQDAYAMTAAKLDAAIEADRNHIARIVGIEAHAIPIQALDWFFTYDEDAWLDLWKSKPWEGMPEDLPDYQDASADAECDGETALDITGEAQQPDPQDPRQHLDQKYHPLLLQDETWWSLQRNAAAAGHWSVQDYLTWRAEAAQ